MMIIVAILLIFIILLVFLLKILLKRSQKARKALNKISDKLFFNTFIRFFLTSNLKLQIGAITAIKLNQESSAPITALWTLLIFNIMPVVFAVTLVYKRDKLNDPKTEKRIGSLYSNLRSHKPTTLTLLWPGIFMLRRSIFIFCTFSLLEVPSLCVVAFILTSIFYIMYIGLFVDFSDSTIRR